MCYFTAAAPADISQPDDVNESEIFTESTSTYIPETTTIDFDIRHNEVDAKLPKLDETTATMSTVPDVDRKIESIEADFEQRPTSEASTTVIEETSTQHQKIHEMEELNESTTIENVKSRSLTTETTSTIEVRTVSKNIAQASEEVQDLKDEKEFEKLLEGFQDELELTTKKTVESPSTTSEITTEDVSQQTVESENKVSKEVISDLTEKAKTLVRLRKLLRAHVLQAALTLLNEARKRQMANNQEQHVMESQIVEETVHAASTSDCGCEEDDDDDVSVNHDDKIIAFDKDLQRYVYMDRADYERANVRNLTSY